MKLNNLTKDELLEELKYALAQKRDYKRRNLNYAINGINKRIRQINAQINAQITEEG